MALEMKHEYAACVDETHQASIAETSYEAPRIEAVVTLEDLEREVLYAGTVSGPGNKTG